MGNLCLLSLCERLRGGRFVGLAALSAGSFLEVLISHTGNRGVGWGSRTNSGSYGRSTPPTRYRSGALGSFLTLGPPRGAALGAIPDFCQG